MKVVTFVGRESGRELPGVLVQTEGQQRVIDVSGLGFASVLELIQAGSDARARLSDQIASLKSVPVSGVKLVAPLPRPPRIFGIGLNYASHAAESNMAVQKVPTVFMKLPSSVVGLDADVILPAVSSQPDYEAELAVVIGKPGYQISAAKWAEHVFGYTICNDVSARDIQLATSQWTLGKSFPTFTPLGPSITTADEVPDPHQLRISLAIDGETLQDSNTQDLIFKVPELIEYISKMTPLEAGDVISTGTPQGVGLGRDPKRWLRPGEEMVIEIERLGTLRNRTVAEHSEA
jgi:2-keto-4-pentenoate hydratase/2-oxohepta-3-ene-1,7-dioic acid hydratase in catechol pathway